MHKGVKFIKRAIDVVGSAIGLGLTLPLFPAIAAAVYVQSPGPIFYRQKRVGRIRASRDGGRSLDYEAFEIVKFRTMVVNAERDGAQLATQGDRRVTPVGRFLRKTRLDELPQLWNVLKGDMSLVGPRPERPELLSVLALAIPFFEERSRDVKPGLTGLAQVSLGYTGRPPPGSVLAPHLDMLTNPFDIPEAEGALADDMRMKLLYDLAYCASLEDVRSYVRMELGVLARTPLVMLRMSGT